MGFATEIRRKVVVGTQKDIDISTRYQQGGRNPGTDAEYNPKNMVAVEEVHRSLRNTLTGLPPAIRGSIEKAFQEYTTKSAESYAYFIHGLYQSFSKLAAPILKAMAAGQKSAALHEVVNQLVAPENNFEGAVKTLANKVDPKSRWESRIKKIVAAIANSLKKVPEDKRQVLMEAGQQLSEIAAGGYEQYAHTSYSIPALKQLILTGENPKGYHTKFDFDKFLSTIGAFKK